MSDWIPREEISPPPWSVVNESRSLEENYTDPMITPLVVLSGGVESGVMEIEGDSFRGVGFTASDGMVLGIGMSFSFVAIITVSVFATRWYVYSLSFGLRKCVPCVDDGYSPHPFVRWQVSSSLRLSLSGRLGGCGNGRW